MGIGILTWIGIGLVAGIIGKMLNPGKDAGGWIVTILTGVVGAFIGGFVSRLIGLGTVDGFNIKSIAIASVGAFLFLYGKKMIHKGWFVLWVLSCELMPQRFVRAKMLVCIV